MSCVDLVRRNSFPSGWSQLYRRRFLSRESSTISLPTASVHNPRNNAVLCQVTISAAGCPDLPEGSVAALWANGAPVHGASALPLGPAAELALSAVATNVRRGANELRLLLLVPPAAAATAAAAARRSRFFVSQAFLESTIAPLVLGAPPPPRPLLRLRPLEIGRGRGENLFGEKAK